MVIDLLRPGREKKLIAMTKFHKKITKKDEIKYVKKLKKEAVRCYFFSMKQSNLDSFIDDFNDDY